MKIMQLGSYNTSLHNKNENNTEKGRTQSFKGPSDVAFNALDKFFSVLDKNAMIQVSFVDTVSTNIPRTVVDLKTSLAASLETFRREFSGLFVNCIMPSGIVFLVAKMLPKPEELKGTNAASSWANSDSIDKLKTVYKSTFNQGNIDNTKEYVEKALTSLRGLNGTEMVYYETFKDKPEFISAVEDITNAINKNGSERDKLLKRAQEKLAKLTKAESLLEFSMLDESKKQLNRSTGISKAENIPQWKPNSNLEYTLRDIVDLGSKFNKIKEQTAKKLKCSPEELPLEKFFTAIDSYVNSLKGFVNKKSFIGMGIVMAIAVSMQSINRAITRKQFKSEGAPIYKDFGKKDTSVKMNEKQKKEFFGKKLLAAASIYALAGLSMMKKPTKEMFQFTGKFPTLDQCRWIAASTFASRMLVSEDENELRESTVRDLASFSGLYFLGDYVKKSAASFFEMLSKTGIGKNIVGENVVLLNRKNVVKEPEINSGSFIDKAKYRIEQLCNWIKNTELKTSNEVSSKNVRNLRNLCRVADISFSLVMLGILLPNYSRRVTEQKVKEAKKLEEMKNKSKYEFSSITKKNTPLIFRNYNKF